MNSDITIHDIDPWIKSWACRKTLDGGSPMGSLSSISFSKNECSPCIVEFSTGFGRSPRLTRGRPAEAGLFRIQARSVHNE